MSVALGRSGGERRDGLGAARLPAEFAFLLRHGLPAAPLVEAARLAETWDVPPIDALLSGGLAVAEPVYRALAAELGLPFLAAGFRAHPQVRFPEAVTCGVAPLETAIECASFVLAPRGTMFAEVLHRRLAPGLAITTPDSLRNAVFAARSESIARFAAEDLPRRRPEDSFHGGFTVGQLVAGAFALLALGALAQAAGGTLWVATALLLGLPFLGLAAIKLAASCEPAPTEMPRTIARTPDRDLPVYTVLIPLYRERRVLPKLLGALRALDYPAAKLDVKLILEEDDRDTADALAGLDVPAFAEVIVAPAGVPRTKPRALNVALPLARGRFLVIYDAEDVPDPGQLRDAVAVFERCETDVACLQARLVIDNTRDGLLTRFFTLEYGVLFDVVNPALARFDLPVPLGGTSNHIRVDVLRELGGWDAFNVTEDADLAMRLAVAGWRVADLPSATLEEAPGTLRAWLAQRARWMKGFVQVTVTHSRRPVRNLGRLGLVRLFGAAAMIFGAVASAAVYPIFAAVVILRLLDGTAFDTSTVGSALGNGIALTLAVAGLVAMTVPGLVAIGRRGWWALWPCAVLMPVYYLFVSLGAWRGLVELVLDPDRWNKTEHGLARTSRSDPGPARVPTPDQICRSNSFAASAGGRSRLSEPMKRPSLPIR